MKFTGLLLWSPVFVLLACTDEGSPTVEGVLEDTIVVRPTRFAGVPGSMMHLGSAVRDTNGSEIFVQVDSVSWTIGDSAMLAITVQALSDWRMTANAAGTTTVALGYHDLTTVIPVEIATATFTTIVAGGYNSCALDTTQRLYCWGSNIENKIAQWAVKDFPGPVRPENDHIYTSIDLSVGHSCGITVAHVLECWGQNHYGERGNGSPAPGQGQSEPVAVSGGHQFASLTVGGGITCGIRTDSLAFCWGRNYRGELGRGDTINQNVPSPVSGGHHFAKIVADGPNLDAMATHTCALDGAGKLWCWGPNTYGQVGDGTNTDRWFPVPVDSANTYTDLAAGGGFNCAIRNDAKVYCWGSNASGALGKDTTSTRNPIPITSGLTFTKVSAGEYHACALATNGGIYCWGRNAYGQLGRATTDADAHYDVVAVTGGHTWTAVSAGMEHTCGKAEDGFFYCWGGYGVETGNGHTSNGTPVAVMGQTGLPAAPPAR